MIYKEIQCLPIVTRYGVYTVKVFIPKFSKQKKVVMTVTDQRDDLKYCEEWTELENALKRVKEIEWELNFEWYNEESTREEDL